MSTILGSQVAPLSARRKWCWAKTGPLQAPGHNKQVRLLSTAWMTKEPDSAHHEYLPKCSTLSSPSYHPKETPEEEKWQRKDTAPLDAQESFGVQLLPPPGSHCHLLKEAQERHQCPTAHPSPSVFLGSYFLCAACTSACTSACFEGFAEEALSNRVLKVFFILMLGWGKSKLAPTAVEGSDQFTSHANSSGVSITGELWAI